MQTTRRVVDTGLKLAVDLAPDAGFGRVERWPTALSGFEDLTFLFTSSVKDYGIAQLTFEEAAFLYRAVQETGPGRVAEIGRFRGGSTFLIASALAPPGRLVSYDLHAVPEVDGDRLDDELRSALRRYGLETRVELVVGDSREVEAEGAFDLVFVDGDHTYEGVRADYARWVRNLAAGGRLLFHDAAPGGGALPGGCASVARFLGEVDADPRAPVRLVDRVGTIAAYTRVDAVASS